jgi:putative ABC transport system substrate-binding protein
MPTMHEVETADSGGYLVTYGPDFGDVYRRAGGYVARIFRGEKPAEMAIEEPRQFRFTVNLKVAKAIGVSVPQAVLLRADEVIQ